MEAPATGSHLHVTFANFPPQFRERLSELHGAADFRGIISGAAAQQIASALEIELHELMLMLLPAAALRSRAPVSGFNVGAVALGRSGSLYYGTNVEFAGASLAHTVHAEQSAVVNAWMGGEEGIAAMAVSAAPCGHCRQFLNELTRADELLIRMPSASRSLGDLLPDSFGPRDLSRPSALMQRQDHALAIDADDPLAAEGLAAARSSYAPYSSGFAGIALQTRSGRVTRGAYAENAAFNPSLAPLPAALSQLNLAGEDFESITEAVLVTADPIHEEATTMLLATVSRAALRTIVARNSASRRES
jgi:cytidine deaminase